MKNKLINIGIILLFVVGLMLVFINPIRDYFVKRSADKLSLNHYTAEQLTIFYNRLPKSMKLYFLSSNLHQICDHASPTSTQSISRRGMVACSLQAP